jgi:hypothetical protein
MLILKQNSAVKVQPKDLGEKVNLLEKSEGAGTSIEN